MNRNNIRHYRVSLLTLLEATRSFDASNIRAEAGEAAASVLAMKKANHRD